MEEAIRTILDSDRQEKRLGVTKGRYPATVDLVQSLNGAALFHGPLATGQFQARPGDRRRSEDAPIGAGTKYAPAGHNDGRTIEREISERMAGIPAGSSIPKEVVFG